MCRASDLWRVSAGEAAVRPLSRKLSDSLLVYAVAEITILQFYSNIIPQALQRWKNVAIVIRSEVRHFVYCASHSRQLY